MLFESLYDTLGHMIFWALFTEIFNYFLKAYKMLEAIDFYTWEITEKEIQENDHNVAKNWW